MYHSCTAVIQHTSIEQLKHNKADFHAFLFGMFCLCSLVICLSSNILKMSFPVLGVFYPKNYVVTSFKDSFFPVHTLLSRIQCNIELLRLSFLIFFVIIHLCKAESSHCCGLKLSLIQILHVKIYCK